MTRRDLIASLSAASVVGFRRAPMRHGPWVQEMLLYRRSVQRRMLREAADLGLDAFGLNLLPVLPGGAHLVQLIPFNGNDLSRPVKPYMDRLEDLVELADRLGIRLYTKGPMFPDIRRLHVTFQLLRFRGRPLTILDWAAWTDAAHEAWSHHQRTVDRLLGDSVTRTDGTEPFTWLLPHPPNRFTELMQADFPGMLRAGIDEQDFKPVAGATVPVAISVTSDGWGDSHHRWRWGPRVTGNDTIVRRPLAALPDHNRLPVEHGSPQDRVAAYFVAAARRARTQGARVFLVLHSTGWQYSTDLEARALTHDPHWVGHPVALQLDVPPFGNIYRGLAGI